MNKKEKNVWKKSVAVECVLQSVGEGTERMRKSVLDEAEKLFEKQCRQKKITDIKRNEARSYVGTVLNELISEKTLFSKEGFIVKATNDRIIVDKAKCKAKLLELLKQGEYGKEELYKRTIEYFGADKTADKDDDNEIKGYLGRLLCGYVEEGMLEIVDGKYRLKYKPKDTVAEKPVSEEDFRKKFLERLHENGGSFFEKFFANVLEKYFTLTGRTVWDCFINGGTDDGGVDIKIKLSDDLGFVDEVTVQAKCRANIQVTENEVRNFYGAVKIVKASRGIFVTTSTFHPRADKLLHSLNDCVGIDGNGVFALSKQVLYGMKITRNGYVFDDAVFDI